MIDKITLLIPKGMPPEELIKKLEDEEKQVNIIENEEQKKSILLSLKNIVFMLNVFKENPDRLQNNSYLFHVQNGGMKFYKSSADGTFIYRCDEDFMTFEGYE